MNQYLHACRCSSSDAGPHAEVADTLRLMQLLQAFRSRGHLVADLDPCRGRAAPGFLTPAAHPTAGDPCDAPLQREHRIICSCTCELPLR